MIKRKERKKGRKEEKKRRKEEHTLNMEMMVCWVVLPKSRKACTSCGLQLVGVPSHGMQLKIKVNKKREEKKKKIG